MMPIASLDTKNIIPNMVVLIESVIFVAKLKYVRENPNINPFAKTITPVTKKQKYVKPDMNIKNT